MVVVAPTRSDSGNLAVLDTLLELVGGPADVVVGGGEDSAPAATAPAVPEGVSVRELPALLTGTKHDRRTAQVIAERLLDGAGHCTVIAPDVIGGRDDVRAFIRCLAVARSAAAMGIDSRVVGFNWTVAGGSAGIQALHAAARGAVKLYVRDDLTLMRGLNDGFQGVKLAADLAFAGTSRDPAVLDAVRRMDRSIAVLAVCSHVTSGLDSAADYIALAEHLQRRSMHVVLLPATSTGDDLQLLGRIARAVAGSGASVVRRPLASAELRALTGGARLTITDRTRIAVVAMSAGSAVLGLATHSELEAMLRTAGLADSAVVPKPGFASVVSRMADRILDDQAAALRVARGILPELKSLARANLAGLPIRDAGVGTAG